MPPLARLTAWLLLMGLGGLAAPVHGQGEVGHWIDRAALPTPRQELPAIALDGKVYTLAGLDRFGGAVRTVEVYDPATDTWATAADLPVPMHHLAAAVAGGRLYVLGGYLGSTFTPTGRVFVYDPAEDLWTEKATMPTARGAQIAGTLAGKIHVVGGARFGQALGTHEVYDPATDTWATAAAMPTPREHLAGAVIAGRLYVVGGRAPLEGVVVNRATLEVYDPATDAWSPGAPMPTARGGLAAAALHGRLYVFGGEFFGIPTGVNDENEEYTPLTNTWRSMPPMTVPRHGLGAAAVGDTVYTLGGATVAGFGVIATNAGFVPLVPAAISTAPPSSPHPLTLGSVYPHPFHTAAAGSFTVPRASTVSLVVYDLLGRTVVTVAQGRYPAGTHPFRWEAAGWPTGTYLLHLRADGRTATRPVLLVR